MIASLIVLAQLGTAQANPTPEITEYPSPKQEAIAIEAIIDLPKLNPAQRYVLSQAMTVAVQMTNEYGNRDVLRVLQTGTRFRLFQAADHLRIGLTVDNDQLSAGLSLLHSVLTQPTFLAETIKVRKSAWSDPWSPAYSGFESQEIPLNREDIVALWQGVVKSKSISLAVSGDFRAGVPTQKWRAMPSGWGAVVPDRLPLAFPPKMKQVENSVPLLIFDSKPITITRANMASYFLAANALGVGKDSILWIAAREEMNLSYRQESFLLPTEAGWKMRMAFATDEDGKKPETIAALRTKLRARCEAFSQADLDHAIGLGKGYLQNQIPTLPLVLGIGDTASFDSNDQLYLKHYWGTHFGFIWDTENLYDQMKSTSLADLKKLLVQLVDESSVRIL